MLACYGVAEAAEAAMVTSIHAAVSSFTRFGRAAIALRVGARRCIKRSLLATMKATLVFIEHFLGQFLSQGRVFQSHVARPAHRFQRPRSSSRGNVIPAQIPAPLARVGFIMPHVSLWLLRFVL